MRPAPDRELRSLPTPVPGEEPWLARSAMHARYGGLLRTLFERLFGPIHYPAQSAELIRGLAKKGVVVYVARSRSTLLLLYFNHALARLGLPLAQFVGGLNLLLWQPVDRLWKLWQQRHRTLTGPWRPRFVDRPPTRSEALLADLALRGEPAFVFLAPPRAAGRTDKPLAHDYMRALVAAQRLGSKPVYLVPHVLTHRAHSGRGRGIADRIFGDARRPGRLRLFAMFLTSLRQAAVRVGEPIDLLALVNEHPDADDQHLGRMVRHELNRRISEEERVVAGPELLDDDLITRHVLRDQELRDAVTAKAKTPAEERALWRRAESNLKEIAARYSVTTVRILDRILTVVFNRIYDGIVVDEPGLARVLEAARTGPLIFCPSHKSHVDYLVLSLILWRHGVAPPHIAAGANLSFFPLGPIFKTCGAFFLRRSFKDDPVYAATFRSYVRELVRMGTSIEFFPEGTRSRTGKLLMPRFGLLGMLVDAWRAGARDDIHFVPVSIDYERIIEARSYERELAGAEKRQEDLGGLLRSTKVLRSRYGRVHVQFAEPISVKEAAARRGLPQAMGGDHEEAWHREIERLGYRVLNHVAMVASVTPTSVVATALLGHSGRGLAEGLLLKRARGIVDFLDIATARLSDSLQNPDNRDAAVLEAVHNLVDDGVVVVARAGRSDIEPIYRVPDGSRILLDYYKNAVMNYFAPAAIVARSLMRRKNGPLHSDDLAADSRFLSRLFKREFLYQVDTTFTSHFDDTLATLAVRGILDVNEDGSVKLRDPETVELLASLLDAFVQAYFVTARATSDLRAFPLWEKELSTRAMERCRRAFLEGTITRPESANLTLIANALRWLKEAGVIEESGTGRRQVLALSRAYAGEALERLIEDIQAFL
jgi:glycerol-3-phosphate O-acyltransferase